MDDLIEHFIVEARELIQQATDDLLALEHDPANAARLDSAFRAVHTLKGSVGLFDFAPMSLALHAGEDLLGALRAGRVAVDDQVIDALLACIAQSERWVGAIEQRGRLPEDAEKDGRDVTETLRARIERTAAAASSGPSGADAAWAEALLGQSPKAAALLKDGATPLVAIRYEPRPDCFFAGDDPVALVRSLPELVALRISNRDPWPAEAQFDPFSCNLVIEALSAAAADDVRAVFRFVPDQVALHVLSQPSGADAEAAEGAAHAEAGHHDEHGSRLLRVDAKRIDALADLVDEMVIAKNGLSYLAGQAADGIDGRHLAQAILASHARIERLVSDMHRAVMEVRMLPLRGTFRRFPRAVRDMATRLGKGIDFAMEGEGVEVDKSIVEGLSEPLLHVIRNAVDHGAEAEEARRRANKPARTRIVLRARRRGDRVVIEVEDDGRGIDPARIRQVARERGVTTPHPIDGMTDAEVLNLVFAPGFSTASEVTDLSGRGVGMDVVRSAIERMGGQVTITSRQGRGTVVSMSLPLTVMMTKVMTVRVGTEHYGIPIDGVVETAFIRREQILPLGDAEAFVLRDRTLPLVRLGELLGGERRDDGRRGEKVLIVPVGNDLAGIAVDRFTERMDVLMRPMSGILSGMPGVIGTTLLGDGSVLMILDLPELLGWG